LIRVRVRGITATAVSKILLDKGYKIVQPSSIIRERFKLDFDTAPADVTVKDSGEDELLVLGFYEKAERVYRDLAETLEYVFQWVSPVGLYSIHVGVVVESVNGTCVVDLGKVRGLLENCRHKAGDRVLVGVERAPLKPGEKLRLSYEVRVVGEYVALIHGSSRVTVSEHIRDPSKRSFLAAVGVSKLIGTGLGIHFRSSSMYAEQKDIEREIEILLNKLKEILNKARGIERAPIQLYEGEFIGLLGLTSLAKEKLDAYRSSVVSTIPYHHTFKAYGGFLSELADFVEKLIDERRELMDVVKSAVEKYVVEKLLQNNRIKIIHIRPDGTRCELTAGYIYKVGRIDGGYRLIVTRPLKGGGVYDGLGVEKREGDIDYMVVETNGWFVSHNYHRGGEWIGSYININTPPEILPDRIKYHDLILDVIVKPREEPKIVDEEEFIKYCSEGILSSKICTAVREKAKEIVENIDRYVYRLSAG